MKEEDVKFGKEMFVGSTGANLRDDYMILSKIGKGGYGQVYRVKNIKSGEKRACKLLSKLNVELERFYKEINILKKLDHPNIIKLYEVYESKEYLYLIMEECKGGELFDKLIEHTEKGKNYTEKEAAIIIKQVMSAIEYCHKNGICHRDLKPENLLYLKSGDENDNPIKLIDFGLSQTLNANKNLESKVGSCYYVAPEILSGNYNNKCDIWSTGVILYILLTGEPPFNGPNERAILQSIKSMKFSFPIFFNRISDEAKDLISHMLAPEEQRYSATQVLQHRWFQIVKEKKLEKIHFNISFLKEYNNANQLKKMVLLYIASRVNDEEIKDLKKVFKAFDKNNDGQIEYEEFKKGLKKIKNGKITEEEINKYFASIDTDKNNKIDYTEFLAATLEKKTFLKEERLYEAFSMLDKDNDGKITKEELISILKLESKDDEYVSELMKNADTNKDGVIDYKEFLNLMGYKTK